MSFGMLVPCIFLVITMCMIDICCFNKKTKNILYVINSVLLFGMIIGAFSCKSTKEFVFRLKNIGRDVLVVNYDAKYEDVQKLDIKKIFSDVGYNVVEFDVYSYTGQDHIQYSTVTYFGVKRNDTYDDLIKRERSLSVRY